MTAGPHTPPLRGVLNPRVGLTKFRTTRRLPPAELAPFVENYWLTWWDLRRQPPYHQQVVSNPRVHVVCTPEYAMAHGVIRRHFVKRLEGRAHVLGVRFRPGGFRRFLGAPLASITDRSLPMVWVFGPDAGDYVRAIRGTEDEDELVAIADAFLSARLPDRDPTAELVAELVLRIESDPELHRVDALAEEFGIGMRRLQRLFAEYVGVGPKWVLLRRRIHEATDRLANDAEPDWATLAAELGYSDQAHFTRDFTAVVRMSPARYVRSCRAAAAPPSG